MTYKSYRAESREEYGQNQEHNLSIDQLNAGSLLRIADAIEKMVQRHTDLIAERDQFERLYIESRSEAESAKRSNAALRGQITKLRNRGGR